MTESKARRIIRVAGKSPTLSQDYQAWALRKGPAIRTGSTAHMRSAALMQRAAKGIIAKMGGVK